MRWVPVKFQGLLHDLNPSTQWGFAQIVTDTSQDTWWELSLPLQPQLRRLWAAALCESWAEPSSSREGWKDLATHLHVMPKKACLQLDLQRKSDISAHSSTSPGGRGLEDRVKEGWLLRLRQTGVALEKTGKPSELAETGAHKHTHKNTHTSGSAHIGPSNTQLFPLHHTRLSPPFIFLPLCLSSSQSERRCCCQSSSAWAQPASSSHF